jgi:hypothetical protein
VFSNPIDFSFQDTGYPSKPEAPAMPQYNLPDDGYLVVDLRLDGRVLSAALSDAEKREYVSIFKEVGGSDDPDRAQSRVECRTAALRAIRDRLNDHARCLDSRWSASVFSYLRSLPGGVQQAAHQDYTSEDIARSAAEHQGSIPASAVVAIMPKTSLKVYPRCFSACEGDGVNVPIPPGHAIIFRGDLIHCGMPYKHVNYRLHCYLTVPDKAWVPDMVTSAETSVYPCQYCDKVYTNSSSARQHRYKCKQNPNYARNKAIRQAKERGKFQCDLCDHAPFSHSGGLRNHHFKKHK